MYILYRVKGVVRIDPKYFDRPLQEAALLALKSQYEGAIHPKLGVIIAVMDVRVSEYGWIIPGDGATYHDVEFSLLAYKPILHEVVEGRVVDVQRFGAFIHLGPIDGFIHISQIMDEKVEFDPQRGAFIGTETKRILEKDDIVRARVVGISMPSEPTQRVRVQLTMRQPMLGKLEWIKSEIERIEKARRAAEKLEAR